MESVISQLSPRILPFERAHLLVDAALELSRLFLSACGTCPHGSLLAVVYASYPQDEEIGSTRLWVVLAFLAVGWFAGEHILYSAQTDR